MRKISCMVQPVILILIQMYISFNPVLALKYEPANCAPGNDYYDTGIEYFNKMDYEEAVRQFDCALTIDSANPQIVFYRAAAYTGLLKYDEAISDYTNVLHLTSNQISPLAVNARFLRALLYSAKGQYELALEEFNGLIQLADTIQDVTIYGGNPSLSQFYTARGPIQHEFKNYDDAVTDFDRAIELNPDDAVPYASRGFAYEMLGNPQQAMDDWNKARKLDTHIVDKYRLNGIDYFDTGNYSKTVETFNKVLKISLTPVATDYLFRGRAYLQLQNYPEAVTDFNTALDIDSQEYTPMFFRGQAYLYLKNYELALLDFNQYINANRFYPQTYFYRGETYFELGDMQNAINDYCTYLGLTKKADEQTVIAAERLNAGHHQCINSPGQ